MTNLPPGYVLDPPPAAPPPRAAPTAAAAPAGGASVALPSGYVVDPGPTPAQIAAAPDRGALAAATDALGNALSFNFMDEAVAAAAAGVVDPVAEWLGAKPVGSTFDERYAKHLADQRLQNAAAEAQHPTASTVGGLAAAATVAPKAIAEGVVAPIMRAATVGERVANTAIGTAKGAAGGGAYSFLSGYGAGEGGIEPRLQSGLAAAPAGAAWGAALGAPLGALARVPVLPDNPVAAAAGRQHIDVPVGVASDVPAIQQTAGALKSTPFFGTQVTDAADRMTADFAARKQAVAADYGGGAAASPASAGQAAKDALENWIGPLSKGVINDRYNAVNALVDPTITTPLDATANAATQIVQRNQAATLPSGGAVRMVQQAVSDPAGLTFAGIKDLRTRVGEMIDDPTLMPADTSQSQLKQIYTGLTTDLRTAVNNAGGPAARTAFDNANLLNTQVQSHRQMLIRELGLNPNNPASAEDVFSTIQRMAGSKSSADIATLNRVKNTLPAPVWDNVASGVVGQLGRSDALGTVSLDKFVTGYNQLSDAGKQALFGNRLGLASALDDLATIAGRNKVVGRWANPSGTAQHGAYLALGAGLLTRPLETLGGLGAAGVLTRALTRPSTVRAMAAYARVWNQLKGGVSLPSRALRPGQIQPGFLPNSMQFAARRLAVELGMQFGLPQDAIAKLTASLLSLANPGVAPAVPSVQNPNVVPLDPNQKNNKQ